MSNALSIAAITTTLRDLLQQEMDKDPAANATVKTLPLDKVSAGNGNLVNLFLYHTSLNAAWRNMDIPWRVKPGEQGRPPLPLNLYYLVTVYAGENEADVESTDTRLLGNHRLLGLAARIFHDHPVLKAADIHAALPSDDQADYPYDQVENIRITPHSLSLDELSKLWTGFQMQYRLSVAYEVSVALIESGRPQRAPLPVLRRGPEDKGVQTAIGPFPVIEDVRRPPGQRFGFQLGDALELIGHNLGGDVVEVRFHHPLLENVPRLPLDAGSTHTRLNVHLPPHDEGTAVSDWAAGFYAVDVVIQKQVGDLERITNQVPVALSPIVFPITPDTIARDGEGSVNLTIVCAPDVLPEQHVRLLLDEREVQAEPHPVATNSLNFVVTDAPVGEFIVRLRIDGVDSLPILLTESGPIFDPEQKVTIT